MAKGKSRLLVADSTDIVTAQAGTFGSKIIGVSNNEPSISIEDADGNFIVGTASTQVLWSNVIFSNPNMLAVPAGYTVYLDNDADLTFLSIEDL